MLNAAWLGWALALVALVVGYHQYGWSGVALAVSVIVFWLLLQFSRALRALRQATDRPVGHVPSAVMFNSKLRVGMRLPDILRLTRSLGRRLGAEPETFAWVDAGGDEVQVELRGGRVTRWELKRAGA